MREAFKDLLKASGRAHDLHFVPEYEIETNAKERRYVDGALLYELRMPFGYWEAKDEKDDLDAEIAIKFKRGYPQDNIIFEDTREAVLIQNRQEVIRCLVDDVARLEKLLTLFFSYERKEVAEFRGAVEQFKSDLPEVLVALRDMVDKAYGENLSFRQASARFLRHAQETINPAVSSADVREMLIQHVLTEDIFSKVFEEDDFHRQNNIAKELYSLEETFFSGDLKKKTLRGLDPYYTAIRSTASRISSHIEKQTFLKVIYENFYKVYNVKAADRLGVVYTPNAIVRFMIESADWLCEHHFGRTLIDKDVDILDPATGTGTFISELLEHFRGQPAKLRYKYLNQLHSNEVAILPYYVANLNIEATYAAITGEYLEYPLLCFVDTLDNVAGLRKHAGHIDDLFGSVSEQNVARINRQNLRRISVIIGNPPYNANQLNENENNKNREYPEIDARIKDTYIEQSSAQKTKLYDMYARFFRWASDRLDANGILAFISNRSFIDSRTFDGFRAVVEQEFNSIYVVDLGGDIRANPQLSGTKHNVFGIQTGVAISFLVKRAKAKGCQIRYTRRPEMETAEEKLEWLGKTQLSDLAMEDIQPDKKHYWINVTNNDFGELLPLIKKDGKSAKRSAEPQAIFRLFSQGVKTNRDEWVCDFSSEEVAKRVAYLISDYNAQVEALSGHVTKDDVAGKIAYTIKWTRKLKNLLVNGERLSLERDRIVPSLYRPFSKLQTYYSSELNEDLYQLDRIFSEPGRRERYFGFVQGTRLDFAVIAGDVLPNYAIFSLDPAQCVPLHRFDGQQVVDNITDWALAQFWKHYEKGIKKHKIDKDSIFNYVYGVLHDPIYRDKYGQDLKRDFPRIPFYEDFWRWAEWGRALLQLHIGYEAVDPAKLTRRDVPNEKVRKAGQKPKCILKAEKASGRIILDSESTLEGVPAEAWQYKLGNRCALEWILDQYREWKPKDLIIRREFDAYEFADYKDHVVDLLSRVTTVSVETVAITESMRRMPR